MQELTKQMLREYASRKAELAELEERVRELRSSIENPHAAAATGMPAAHNNHASEDKAIRFMQLEALYLGKLRELEWQTVAVENAIATLPSLHRRVMRMVYLDGLSWDEVAAKIGYSKRHAQRYHDAAILMLDIV